MKFDFGATQNRKDRRQCFFADEQFRNASADGGRKERVSKRQVRCDSKIYNYRTCKIAKTEEEEEKQNRKTVEKINPRRY